MDAVLNAAPLRPPQADRTAPGLLLALAAHAVLIGLVVLNVDFNSNVTATTAEAELWSAVPQAAAPRAVEPPPQPEPPVVKPAPEPTPAPDPALLRRDADIAVAQQKERERARREREQEAAEQKREQQRQRLAEEAAEEATKRAAEKKRQQAAVKPKPPPPDKPRSARAEPPPPDDKLRQEQLRRIQGLAGATGDAGATGTAQRSAGFSASYAGRIAGRIKPNVVFPDALPGNPAVEVELRLSADGHIVSRRVTKASGAADWDQAVLRAIDKTDMLPPDTDGRVPPIITLIYHPKDLGG